MTRHTDFVVRNLFDMGLARTDYAALAHWRQRFTHAGWILKSSALMTLPPDVALLLHNTAKPDLTPAISVVQLTAERV